jgi:hypothetical protein
LGKKLKSKKERAKKPAKVPLGRRLAAAGAVAVMLLLGGLGVIEFAPGVAGNLADNVLRPVFGNQVTVALESFMLNAGDQLRQVAYWAGQKPNADIYSSEPTPEMRLAAKNVLLPTAGPKRAKLPIEGEMNLTPVKAFQTTFPKLPGEGEWQSVGLPQFQGRPLMARTFVRTDPDRAYSITALIKSDMHALRLSAVAGTYYPGAQLGHPGPGVIPEAAKAGDKLVAAFNGGFQFMDGHYGMLVGDTTYVPMIPGMGTLTMFKSGNLAINRYDPAMTTVNAGQIEAMRQNGPLIVDQGKVTADATQGGYSVWGRTTTESMYTWRSGVGLDKRGDLVYAVGPSLTAETLAKALQAGGAVEGMQLDINSFWVRYITFLPQADGGYTSQSILNDLQNGGPQYLHGYNKDFFYLTLR